MSHLHRASVVGISEHGDVVFATEDQVKTYQLPFDFGSKVIIDGHSDIKATVIGFAIYPHSSEVQVGWFANGDAKMACLALADWRA